MTDGGYLYSTCWQVEGASYGVASSYIPTSGSQVTRATETCIVSGQSFNSAYTQGQGTLYIESWLPGPRNAGGGFTAALYNTGNDYIGMQYVGGSGAYYATNYIVVNGGSSGTSGTAPTATFNAFHKEAISFSQTSASHYFDGYAIANGTYVGAPLVYQLSIGSRDGAGQSFPAMGSIRHLTYWPQQLTNAQLSVLTSFPGT
jgi:hypothetical protein